MWSSRSGHPLARTKVSRHMKMKPDYLCPDYGVRLFLLSEPPLVFFISIVLIGVALTVKWVRALCIINYEIRQWAYELTVSFGRFFNYDRLANIKMKSNETD